MQVSWILVDTGCVYFESVRCLGPGQRRQNRFNWAIFYAPFLSCTCGLEIEVARWR